MARVITESPPAGCSDITNSLRQCGQKDLREMVPPGSALPVVAVSCAPMTQVTRVATCTTAVLLSVWTLSAQQKPKTRRIFMSVVDPANKPVLDLTAADV